MRWGEIVVEIGKSFRLGELRAEGGGEDGEARVLRMIVQLVGQKELHAQRR